MDQLNANLTKTQNNRMENAQEWAAADADLKILIEEHQKDMYDFQVLKSNHEQEV